MEDKIKEIEAILQEGLSAHAFPGGQYALVYKDKIFINYFGLKSYEPKIENRGHEIYDVASLTKTIATTTLAHFLIYQGHFSLDTYVVGVLKDYPHKDVQIKDLMGHSSGLPADIQRASLLKNKQEVIDKLYDLDLVYKKGEKVIYSCAGYLLLGIFIETVMKKPLNILAEEIIFKPLNMVDTSYFPPLDRVVPTEYRDDPVFKGYLIGRAHDEKAFAMGNVAGNAGLFSTASDIAKYIQSILRQEFIFPNESIDLMFQSYIQKPDSQGVVIHRSLGWAKPPDDKNTIIMHTGYTGCNMWIDRKQEIGFVLLTNGVHPKRTQNNVFPYREKIYNIFQGGKEK